MPIIRPSRTFAGSEINSNGSTNYIKSEVRQITFKGGQNKDGAWLYFLPAYELDAEGNGVWYLPIKVRDNFGEKFKEKYVVYDSLDPVTYFEKNFRALYPDEAKVVDEVNDKGRSVKRYPNYGRVTTRVLFNVAYVSELEKGAHVLDLPSYNGANILLNWLKGKDASGRERPLLNDPDKCIPVFIKLNDGASGAPWQIEPERNDAGVIPDQLADSDYLYKLNDVYVKRSNAELLDKLREMYRSDIFDRCMAGYPGFDKVVVPSTKTPTTSSSSRPSPRPAPALNIPKANVSSAPVEPSVSTNEDKVEVEETDVDSNPMAAPSIANMSQARAFLEKRSGR